MIGQPVGSEPSAAVAGPDSHPAGGSSSGPAAGAGLIVANLLAESAWAGESPALSAVARRRLGEAGLLMAAFARGPGDALWLPAPLELPAATGGQQRGEGDAKQLGRSPWVGGPCPLLRQPPGDRPSRLLGWASTPETWRLRQRADGLGAGLPTAATSAGRAGQRAAEAGFAPPARQAGGGHWRDRFWQTAPVSPDLARRLASRAWFQTLTEGLGLALPGSRLIRGEGEVLSTAEAGGLEGAEGWVLKRLWSAAGRDRAWLHGHAAPDDTQSAWIRRALARDGGLLLEPWMARDGDWGCIGWVEGGSCRILSSHRQLVDGRGRFQGIRLWPGVSLPTELPDPLLPPGAAVRLEAAAQAAGRALAAEGYQGPFGIDAWSYRLPEGGRAFQSLGEVNVRCTMGLVAWAWSRALDLPVDGRAWTLSALPPRSPEARAATWALPPEGWVAGDGVGGWLSAAAGS